MGKGQLPAPLLETIEVGGIPLLTDEALYRACGVRIAFTGRLGGVSTGDYAALNIGDAVGDDFDAVAENRERLFRAIGADALPVIVPKQVHGTAIVDVRGADDIKRAQRAAASGADAVIVEVAGVSAMLAYADCLPLIIVSPSARFAVVHAGWRGAVAHIARKAAEALSACDGLPSSGYNAYIGAHIGVECFEVGEEVSERFLTEFGKYAVAPSGNVDLSCAVACDLVAAGLDASRIFDAEICTMCNSDRYYSYRASSGRCGRHAAIVFK